MPPFTPSNRRRRLFRAALCSAVGVSLLSLNPVGAQEPAPAAAAAVSQSGPSNSDPDIAAG